MTKPTVETPRRWVDDPNASGDGRLGALFGAVEPAEPLSPAALAHVHARLGVARRTSLFQRRMREAVLACVMLLAGSSLAVAGWGVTEWWSARRAPALAAGNALAGSSPAASALAPGKRASALHNAVAALPTPSVSAAFPDLAPVKEEDALAPHTTTLKDTDRRASNAADESALAAESLALQNVLVKLRREHDASGALALLDQSQPLFTRGALALEAQVARVDALLSLGRQDDALAILNHLPLAHMGRGGELRLQRAELRARTDCGLALADFDTLTRQTLAPALAERALYGRAVCELRVADDSHAQSDLRDYLTRFPKGRFAAAAAQQLARMPQKSP